MPEIDVGATLDRYELRQMLASGAMGKVFLAWDPKLHREVAVKVLRDDLGQGSKAYERFQREARAVAALQHPNIVEIYDYSGHDSSVLYIVMERLEGDDLFNILSDTGQLPDTIIAAIGYELCAALAVAHDAGVIHRDLKPENIFITPSGRIVLTDFGIVKSVRENSTLGGFDIPTEVIGTPGFMPPELMMNKALGPYTDVFGLGVLLYNIATEELPYDGAGPVVIFKKMMTGVFVDPRKYNDNLGTTLADAIIAALEPDILERTPDVEPLKDACRSVLADAGVTDLRDDLRDFVADPGGYRERADRRLAGNLVERIKISVKDKDHVETEVLRARLFALEPDNVAVYDITGVNQLSDAAEANIDQNTRERQQPVDIEGRSSGWWVYMLSAVAVAGLVVTLSLGTGDDAESGPSADEAGELSGTQDGQSSAEKVLVNVAIRGGSATVLVDGVRVGHGRRHTLGLLPGKHRIEVKRGKKSLRRVVTIKPSKPLNILVEWKRGRISLR